MVLQVNRIIGEQMGLLGCRAFCRAARNGYGEGWADAPKWRPTKGAVRPNAVQGAIVMARNPLMRLPWYRVEQSCVKIRLFLLQVCTRRYTSDVRSERTS
jgi:hypothetical protein